MLKTNRYNKLSNVTQKWMQQTIMYSYQTNATDGPTKSTSKKSRNTEQKSCNGFYIWERPHVPRCPCFHRWFVYFVKTVLDHHVHNLINECKFWTCIGEQDKRRLLIDMIRKYYIKIEVQKTPLKGCLAILLLTKVQMDVNIVCKFEFSFEEFSFPQYLYFFLFTWHCLPSPWSPQLSGTEQRIIRI